MSKVKLFDDSDNSENEELKENTDYAKNYMQWRRKEEEHKYEAKHGKKLDLNDLDEDLSESSSSEDDEGEEISEDFNKSFYKTLACLKNKDPRIYDENVKFFKEVDEKDGNDTKKTKEKKEKPLFLRDYESKMVLDKGGKFSDSDSDQEEENEKYRDPTYVQEQHEIRESFKKALQEEDNEDEEDFLKPKTKTKEEIQKEEDDYAEFLKGQKKDIDEEDVKELEPLRDFWTDPNLDKNEKFLRDYVLNKGFLEKDAVEVDLDYEEKVHDSDNNLSEDERNINEQEQFEHKYNFRFEEPDQEFIKKYPRTLENTLRKKDTRRAQKRAEVKARKEQEKLQKREELKQLKAMKRKEIEEKLEKLKEITGNDDLRLDLFDLDADYDPEQYDKQMSQVFNDEYYAGEEGDIKPEFPEIDEELCVESTWDNYDPNTDEIVDDAPYHDGLHCEDPDFNMDAEYDGKKQLEKELVESTKKRKRRRRSKFAEMISKEKPKFDPQMHSSYKEYFDQYYALDYEDMIGDLPCRFKYREVVPNDYGLTVEEILTADDKELNKWCSLKKALEYKPEDKELLDVKRYKQRAANEALKKKILKSLYRNPQEEENPAPLESVTQNSKTSKKRKKNKKPVDQVKIEESTTTATANPVEDPEPPKKKKKNKEKKLNPEQVLEVNTENNLKSSIKKEVEDAESSSAGPQKSPISKSKNKKQKKDAESSSTTSTQEVSSNIKKEKENTAETSKSGVKNEKLVPNKTEGTEPSLEKKKKKKKGKNSDETLHQIQNGGISKSNKQTFKNKNKNVDNDNLSKKEKRKLLFKQKNAKLKEKSKDTDQINFLSDERLKAYGLNPKKFKNKLKYGKKK